MSRLPSRPHDQHQTIARSSFFSSRQRHFMTDRVQIQLVLAKNSRPSSSRTAVVPQHAKPIAISPALPIWPRASPPNTPQYSAPCSFLSLRSEEHTSELQSRGHLVCRLLLEKKKT